MIRSTYLCKKSLLWRLVLDVWMNRIIDRFYPCVLGKMNYTVITHQVCVTTRLRLEKKILYMVQVIRYGFICIHHEHNEVTLPYQEDIGSQKDDNIILKYNIFLNYIHVFIVLKQYIRASILVLSKYGLVILSFYSIFRNLCTERIPYKLVSPKAILFV